MSFEFLDHEILNDFLTESAELIDELDVDLVTLEEAPEDSDLLNRIFRALHTIKGSASFLAITNLVDFAHKAEDALNVIRKGEVQVDAAVMDALLRSVDVLRTQLAQLESGEDPAAGPADLISDLIKIASGKLGAKPEATPQPTAEPEPVAAPETTAALVADDNADSKDNPEGIPLELAESKQELVGYMVEDLKESLEHIEHEVQRFNNPTEVSDAAVELHDITAAVSRCVDFFEFDSMASLVSYLEIASNCIDDAPESALEQIVPRLGAIVILLKEQCRVLETGFLKTITASVLGERLIDLLLGHELDDDTRLAPGATPEDAMQLDGVSLLTDNAAPMEQNSAAGNADAAVSTETSPDILPTVEPTADAPVPNNELDPAAKAKQPKTNHRVESTIRVEVSRLETLLNLVGELVIQKNRIAALARQLGRLDNVESDLIEAISQASNDLDHTTGQIQVGVMRTRMQPLDKLFGKYPRLVRDLARNTQKKIDLQILGGETEVDKSILEKLGDPLVHILRNSADHGIESIEDRVAAGKPEMGLIRIRADHQGSHVVITIEDDGKGINRKVVGRKAIEKGILTEAELEALSDDEVVNLIMAAGFSTAEQVSDLSGRGVGMDVVRTNIHDLGGELTFTSVEGQGSVLAIKIPLTVAILNAMMVEVGEETYAVPLTNILEIVKPEGEMLSTVNNRMVLRLRNTVMPVVDLREELSVKYDEGAECFAVVVGTGDQQFGLMVTGLIGQQEIVIKPLDEMIERNEAISGATVREDGGISMILDVSKIIEQKTSSGRLAA